MVRRVRHIRKKSSEKGNSGKKYVYLGKRVNDIPPKGLSSTSEVRNIVYAIAKDYHDNKINKTTFNRRTAILGLAVVRDNDFTPRQKAFSIAFINVIREVEGLKPLKFKNIDKEKYDYYHSLFKEIFTENYVRN